MKLKNDFSNIEINEGTHFCYNSQIKGLYKDEETNIFNEVVSGNFTKEKTIYKDAFDSEGNFLCQVKVGTERDCFYGIRIFKGKDKNSYGNYIQLNGAFEKVNIHSRMYTMNEIYALESVLNHTFEEKFVTINIDKIDFTNYKTRTHHDADKLLEFVYSSLQYLVEPKYQNGNIEVCHIGHSRAVIRLNANIDYEVYDKNYKALMKELEIEKDENYMFYMKRLYGINKEIQQVTKKHPKLLFGLHCYNYPKEIILRYVMNQKEYEFKKPNNQKTIDFIEQKIQSLKKQGFKITKNQLSQINEVKTKIYEKLGSKVIHEKTLSDRPEIYREAKTYLIKNKRNGLYKIGKSINPRIREKTLQAEEPELEKVKVWNYDIEDKLHRKYQKQRVRGEWFNLSKIQVNYICTHFDKKKKQKNPEPL